MASWIAFIRKMLLKPLLISIIKISLIFPRITVPYFENLNYTQKLEGQHLYLTLRLGVIKDMPYNLALAINKIEVKKEKKFPSLARKIAGKGTYMERIQKILHWIRKNVVYDEKDRVESPVIVLEKRRGSCIGFSSLATALLNSIEIPAKIATGYIIRDGKPVPHRWIEVYFPGQGWAFFDPQKEIDSPDYIFMGYNGLSTWPVFSLKTIKVEREIRN